MLRLSAFFAVAFLSPLVVACGEDAPTPTPDDPGPDMTLLEPDMGSPDPDLGSPTGQAGGSPSMLSFRHIPGETECPQTIGSLMLTNDGTETVEASLRPLDGESIRVGAQSVSISAGGTADVDVLFTCRVPTIPILLETSVVATFDDGSLDYVLAIEGDVR